MNPLVISRRTALGAGALATLGLVAACGGGESTSDSTASAAADGVEDGAFPATLESKFGTTTVTKAPERVVVVGLTEQDALLALGIVPVATTKWFGEADGGIFPWAEDKLGDAELPEVLDATNGIPVEKVAALAPDLIVGVYSGMTQQEFDLLTKLAPTVAQTEKADYTESWQDTTLAVGKAIGRPAAAQKLVDDVEAQIAAAAKANPQFKGQQAVVVTPYEGLYVYGSGDPRGRMLDSLGFTFPTALNDPDAGTFGWSLSPESTSDLGPLDVVVWLDYASAPSGMSKIFEATPAYKEGRYFSISDDDGAYYVAQSMVTPLSIPYTLERYLPQLTAAADGDPKTEPPTPKA